MAPSVTPSRREAGPRPNAGRRIGIVAIVAVGLTALGLGVLGGARGGGSPAASPDLAAAASIAPLGSAGRSLEPAGAPSATRRDRSRRPHARRPSRPASSRPTPARRSSSGSRRPSTAPGRSSPSPACRRRSSSLTGRAGRARPGANVATKTLVTPDTAFAFASMSKTFTSAVILQLIDEGKLALSDPAVKRLPAGLPVKVNPRITVAMLLDHTSGLADYFLNPKIDPALQRDPGRAWTPADALRFVGKPLSAPGKAWHYSNTNYLLLGLIAERATGKPLATLVRERLLDPLGLAETWYQAGESAKAPLADGYRVTSTKPAARPTDLADGSGVAPFRSVVTAAGGAGSIAGTSADIARWARALYGGDVLGPVGTGILLSEFTKTRGYLPGVSYGFGVQALSIDGHPSLGHSGKLLGFRGAVRHFPIDGLTISVLTNQSRADPGTIVRSLLRVVSPPATHRPRHRARPRPWLRSRPRADRSPGRPDRHPAATPSAPTRRRTSSFGPHDPGERTRSGATRCRSPPGRRSASASTSTSRRASSSGAGRGQGRGDRRPHREQGAGASRRGPPAQPDLDRRHLLGPARRAAIAPRRRRADLRPAPQRGAAARHQGPLEDDQGRAGAGPRALAPAPGDDGPGSADRTKGPNPDGTDG